MKLFGQFQEAPKRYANGTHRVCTPEETLERILPCMPVLGITRLANITGLDRIGLPVYVAVRPNSRALATAQGKGSTRAAAKASALMESVETWHGERAENPVRIDSHDYLSKYFSMIDVHRIELLPGAHLSLDRPMSWLMGEDLMSGHATLVPYECVSNNFVRSSAEETTFGKSTNGLASGNHILEAVSHGLCEVIERDALAMWPRLSSNERKPYQVNLDSVADPHLVAVLNRLTDVGLSALVWQVPSGIGVPVYTCEIAENPANVAWRPIPISGGHGCHLDPSVAMARAIHEAIQSRATLISGSRDDVFPDQYASNNSAESHLRWREAADPQGTLSFDCNNLSLSSDTFEKDITRLLGALKGHGISQVVAVNLTQPDIGIPVVKIVVPGLRGVYNVPRPDYSLRSSIDVRQNT